MGAFVEIKVLQIIYTRRVATLCAHRATRRFLRRSGSNVYPQSICWTKNKKNKYNHLHTLFYYMNVGFKGIFITRT